MHRPLTQQGSAGILIKLNAHEIAVLAQIGGEQYTSLSKLVRDLLRMALAPRVAVIAEAKHKQEQWARRRFDKGLQLDTSERAARRANPVAPSDFHLISDEPLEVLTTNVPASDCAAFKCLAAKRSMSVSALLREMVREAITSAGHVVER